MKAEHHRTADEWDAFSGWRKVLCYIQRPGVLKAIKKRSHRIDRRAAKRAIMEELHDRSDTDTE